MINDRVVLGFDAAGRDLALAAVVDAIERTGRPVHIENPAGIADYPDVAERVCAVIREPGVHSGILICGTGIGMSIAANKFPGIFAARCTDVYSVEKARRNAGANVLTMGSEVTTPAIALTLVATWLRFDFDSERSKPKVARVRAFDSARTNR